MTSQSRSSGKLIDTGDLELQRRRSLLQLLHNSKNPVGRAFKKLCDAGCDPQRLEHTLLGLKNYPFGRSQIFTKNHAKQFEAVIGDLESAAGRLEQIPDLLIFVPLLADWPSLAKWPAAPKDNHERASLKELSGLLRTIAKRLRKIVSTSRLQRFRGITASHRLPRVIEQIRKGTNGKPYWAETAALVSAAYNRSISAQHLKEIERSRQTK